MKIAAVVPNYNSAALVSRCAAALLAQDLPDGAQLEVVVVDDGSSDGSAARLQAEFDGRIGLVRLPANIGQAAARNAGAAGTDADWLLFVDSDCIPTDRRFVAAHLQAAAAADLVFGRVWAPGPGFWDELQRVAFAGRLRRFERGDVGAYTTQNVSMRADLFARARGFDPALRHGFEDRDLFLRLAALGARATHAPDACVLHEDRIGLASLARKMESAGYHSARTFARRHPRAYATMPFSRLDAGCHRWLRMVDVVAWPLAALAARTDAPWLEWRWLPFAARAALARLLYGLAYLHGTARRLRDGP